MFKKRLAWLLLAIVASFLCLPLFAQTPCSDTVVLKVADIGTQETIPGAQFAIEEQQTLTDENGIGLLTHICKNVKHIHVTALGYWPVDTNVNFATIDTLQVQLRSNNQMLRSVEVNGHRHLANTSNAVSQVNAKEISKRAGDNLANMLNGITGVTMLQTGATISKPVVHGMHSNRLLILNNGIRQEGQQWGSEHAPEIDPLIAQKLTVIKGAESVRYGPEAIGGVVLVEPGAIAQDSSIHGQFNLTGANNGRSGMVSGMLSGNVKRLSALSWRAQGSAKKGGNIRTGDYYLDNTGTREYNYSVNANYSKARFELDLFYSHFQTELGIFKGSHIGSVSDLEVRIANGRPFDNGSFYYSIDAPRQMVWHNLFKAQLHYHINDQISSYMVYGFQTDNRKEYDIRRGGRSSIPSLNLTLVTNTIDAGLSYAKGNNLKSYLGFNGMFQQNTYDGSSGTRQLIPDYNANGAGLYFTTKYTQTNYEIEAGLRYDYKFLTALGYRDNLLYGGERTFHNISGTLGVNWEVSKGYRLSSQIGTAWRPPAINELYSDGLHHGAAAIEIGDSTLQAEQSVKWVTSLSMQPTKWLTLNADVYTHYFHNYIYLNPTGKYEERLIGAFPVFEMEQTNAFFTGLDFDLGISFLKVFAYKSKVAMIRARDIAKQNYLPMIPADRWEQSISWHPLSMPNKIRDAYFEIGHTFVAKQNRYKTGSDFAPPPSAYHLFNVGLGANYLMNKQSIGIHLAVTNLANILYKDYLNRFRYYAHDMGRNITVRINYNF